MVRPIDSSVAPHALNRSASSTASLDATTEVSKPGAHGIGRQAKAAISAVADGRELPKNIQGKVASTLARGLPLETIVSLQEIAEPAGDGAAMPGDPAIVVVDPEVDVLPTDPLDETVASAELMPKVDDGEQVSLEETVPAVAQLAELLEIEPI